MSKFNIGDIAYIYSGIKVIVLMVYNNNKNIEYVIKDIDTGCLALRICRQEFLFTEKEIDKIVLSEFKNILKHRMRIKLKKRHYCKTLSNN